MFLHEVDIDLGHNYNCVWLYVLYGVIENQKK